MCYPFFIWNTNSFKKVHPKIKKQPFKKVKFFGFRYRNTLIKVDKPDKQDNL
jgi:hypothetical protein